jgi:hypothetical protein
MKKFYIEFTIFPIIKKNITNYILDIKKIFTPDFIKQNYHKHVGYSLVLTFFAIWFLFAFAHLGDTGNFFPIFVGGFGAYAVNWLREAYYNYKSKDEIKFDQTDINMGSYGGIIGAILFLILQYLL